MTTNEKIVYMFNLLPQDLIPGFQARLAQVQGQPEKIAKLLSLVEDKLQGGGLAGLPAKTAPSGDVQVWRPNEGLIGQMAAIAIHTAWVGGLAKGLRYRFLVAFNGSVVNLVSEHHIGNFFDCHQNSRLWVYDAPVTAELLLDSAKVDLRDWLDKGLLVDPGILYRLVILAETGEVPETGGLSLATITDDVLHRSLPPEMHLGACPSSMLTIEGELIPDGIPGGALKRLRAEVTSIYEIYKALEQRVVAILEWAPVWDALRTKFKELLLSHDIQLKSAFALREVSKNGLHVDQDALTRIISRTSEKFNDQGELLQERYAYWPGAGSGKRYAAAIAAVEAETGNKVARTSAGFISQKADDLAEIDHPFVEAFLAYQELSFLQTQFLEPLAGHSWVHPEFEYLLRTGRTSCHRPNLQGIPKDPELRGVFTASPGFLLLAADYSVIELCALAQICQHLFGHSVMLDMINQGVDLHKGMASQLESIPVEQVTGEQRQQAKSINFGFPGGLGPEAFIRYAAAQYGVIFTLEQAKLAKQKWLAAFPEMKDYLDYSCPSIDWSGDPQRWGQSIAAQAAVRVLKGTPLGASSGAPYPEDFVNWVWNTVANGRFFRKSEFKEQIGQRRPSDALAKAIQTQAVVWPSGRVVPGCTYTQVRNYKFQGYVADQAKRALYALVRNGYRVVNFIHDEVLVELPEDGDHLAMAKDIERTMVEEMQRSMGNVQIKVEYALMKRWTKAAKAVYELDADGKPIKLLSWKG